MSATYRNPIARNGDFADPFVLRHNGEYYLYATNPGVPVWTSTDLVNWTRRGDSVPEGTFPDLVPFAPEVVYREGAFYMYTSPSGQGHTVLRATDPLGPFVPVSGNVGHAIDGHVFDDGDGRAYFYWAGDEGIWAAEVTSPSTFGEPVLTGAFMDGWTEGPFILKRGDEYHMTLTGNHYLSPGYRIDAAVSDSPMADYKPHPLNPILVSTESNVVGLGHSSSVVGPDLVSTYLIYHNLNADESRDLNLDRQVFHGGLTHVHGPSREALAPVAPDIEYRPGAAPSTEWLTVVGSLTSDETGLQVGPGGQARWSASVANGDFTAEYVLIPDDAAGSHGVQFDDPETGRLVLAAEIDRNASILRVLGAQGDQLASTHVRPSEIKGVLHTIGFTRVGARWQVAFNGRATLTLEGGPLGTVWSSVFSEGASARIGYCAQTHSTSVVADRTSVKPVPGRFPADGPSAHARAALDSGSELPLQAIVLEAGEDIPFDLLVHGGGQHDVLLVGEFQANTRLDVISGVEVATVVAAKHDRGLSARLELGEGLEKLILRVRSGWAAIAMVSAIPAANEVESKTDVSLSDYDKTLVRHTRPGPFSARATVQWSDQPDARADLLFCASELAYGDEGNDPRAGHDFFLGYSVQLSADRVVLARHSYSERVLAEASADLTPGAPHVIVVSSSGGHISVAVDGVVSLRAIDPVPHMHGGIGLRAASAEARLTDLVVEHG